MSDCYEWIDPFAERTRAERAERRAAHAFEDGRQGVLRAITERKEGDFRRVLDIAIERLVDRIAEGDLRPHIQSGFPAYEAARQRGNERARLILDYARPAVAAIHQNGELRIDLKDSYSAGGEVMTVEYVEKPFRPRPHGVIIDPDTWRR